MILPRFCWEEESVSLRGQTAIGRCDFVGADTYGGEVERVNLDAEGRNVLLLKLSRQVALDERGLNGEFC